MAAKEITHTKVALVTGSSGSIGKAIVDVFHQKGYKVVGLDRKMDTNVDYFVMVNLNEFVESSLLRESIINKITDYLNPNYKLVAVVNNAAEQLLNKTEDLLYQEWQQTMNVNVTAPFLLIQGLLNELIEGKGSAINIASIHNNLTKPRFVAYATSKAALVGLTKSMAVDLAGKIRVNCISPAAVETPMLQAGFPNEDDYQQLKAIHPVGRIGLPKEIAEMVYFLASENAGFINGANIEIDGGISSVLKDL